MKWVPFAILTVVTIVCQTTFVQAMAIHSIWPNWMFILAVHYALWGPWPDAALAAWLLGLTVDLAGTGRIGLHAFCFGAAAWAIMHIRQAVFRDHPTTQILLTLLFMLAVQWGVVLYHVLGTSASVSWRSLWWTSFFTAVYTAAWAPYLHWPLLRLERWMGLHGPFDKLARR